MDSGENPYFKSYHKTNSITTTNNTNNTNNIGHRYCFVFLRRRGRPLLAWTVVRICIEPFQFIVILLLLLLLTIFILQLLSSWRRRILFRIPSEMSSPLLARTVVRICIELFQPIVLLLRLLLLLTILILLLLSSWRHRILFRIPSETSTPSTCVDSGENLY